MKYSNIQWTTHTFNPWEGCTKVSPGCLHCYAEARNKRWNHGANWGPGAPRRRTSPSNWKQVFKWDAEARLAGIRARVFCASLADWLDDEVPIEWLADLLELVRKTPNLDWLLLTKRPQNWDKRVGAACSWMSPLGPYAETKKWLFHWLGGLERENYVAPANVWIGTTVEDQTRADLRISQLTAIPARIRFLSVEPLLEQVDLKLSSHLGPIVNVNPNFSKQNCLVNWVIVGGESGSGARPFFAEWADDLRRQCFAAGVPFFMKQFGCNVRTSNANAFDWPDHVTFTDDGESGEGFAAARVGFNDRGHGGDLEEFPEELKVREFPS